MRVKSNLLKPFKLIRVVQSSSKNISLSFFPKLLNTWLVPPRHEGRIAIVTTREAGCGGRKDADRRTALFADGEVVWSWRAHAGAKFSGRTIREDDGGKRWFTGESAK